MTNPTPHKTKITAGQYRLIDRRDYLKVAASKRRWITPAFILQALPPSEHTSKNLNAPVIGYTASKKVGKANQRNRARRRLKEATAKALGDGTHEGWLFVVVARQAAVAYPFEKLVSDVRWALKKLEKGVDLKNNAPKPKAAS